MVFFLIQKDKIINYKVQYNGQDLETDMVLYGDLEEALARPVSIYIHTGIHVP